MRKLADQYPWCRDDLSMFDDGGHLSGWREVMSRLLASIEKRYKEHGLEISEDRFSVRQVKEKFGALRVYVNCRVDVEDLRQVAESESLKTCMSCGKQGAMVVSGGWFHVVCDQHRERGDLDPGEYLRRCEERERRGARYSPHGVLASDTMRRLSRRAHA